MFTACYKKKLFWLLESFTLQKNCIGEIFSQFIHIYTPLMLKVRGVVTLADCFLSRGYLC